MKQLRIPSSLYQKIIGDLHRPCRYSNERVGFLFAKPSGNNVLVASGYESIPDEFYLEDDTVGARIDYRAIALAMKRADQNNEGILHVHIHNKFGVPNSVKLMR